MCYATQFVRFLQYFLFRQQYYTICRLLKIIQVDLKFLIKFVTKLMHKLRKTSTGRLFRLEVIFNPTYLTGNPKNLKPGSIITKPFHFLEYPINSFGFYDFFPLFAKVRYLSRGCLASDYLDRV